MAEETKAYSNVSRAKFNSLRESIRTYVALPDGDAGTISSNGVSGSYAYDEPAQTLTLTVSEAPFFIPRAMIWSTIERALE